MRTVGGVGFTIQQQGALRSRQRAKQRERQLRAACPHEAGDSEDLASAHRKARLARVAGPQILHGQALGSRHGIDVRIPLGEPAAHHHLDDRILGQRGGGGLADEPTVPEHGHAVGDLEDLLQPVRDVDHRLARGPQLPDHPEQALALGVGQRAGRLIHDDDARVERQGLGDLDHLLLADAERPDPGGGRGRHAEPRQEPLRARVEPLPGDVAEPCHGLTPEEDVLGDRQLLDQVQLLVDDGDALELSVPGSLDLEGLALEHDLSLGPGIGPAQDLHERGLARSVLSHEGHDLTGKRAEIDAVQGADPRELLGDSPHLEDRRAGDRVH